MTQNDSVKYLVENHSFRGARQPEKDISPKRFRTSSFLNKHESIDKALADSSRFFAETYRKKLPTFRTKNGLRANPLCMRINLPETEVDRINTKLRSGTQYDNDRFDLYKQMKPDTFRETSPRKWLTRKGFR